MKKVVNIIKTIITYFLWAVGSPFFVLILVILSYFPPGQKRYDNRLYHFFARLWARYFFFVAFVRFFIKGKGQVPCYPEQPSIVLINHASLLDIPLVESLFKGYPHIWICNDYSKIPLFGTMLRRMHLIVDRSELNKTIHTIRQAYALLKDRPRHLFIFPEGTRHRDGKIHEFFGGYAILAEKLQRPVIPVVLSGLHKIFPKGSLLIDSSACAVKISIGKPIYYADFTSRQAFMDAVHNWFKQELELLKKE